MYCLVNVLSDPTTSSIDLTTNHRKGHGYDVTITETGMLDMQSTERYKAISLQAVDKVAEL